MPKLKVLDTRQTAEEILVMSWSPKMDLLALGNNKGVVHLHRLSWQKVWQVTLTLLDEPALPELMTWHPEGLFLVVTSGETTFVIDVEGGKVVHNHEISFHITTARWCSSQYEHSLTESLSSHFRQQQIQRLESNLSILFLGTANGYIYAYTGGFLLGLCAKISEEHGTLRTLQVECIPSLESFFFVAEEVPEATSKNTDVTIIFSHFRNSLLPKMAPIIRPLGLRYILFLKNWATIQTEFSSLNEAWAKIVDLYTNYMTFGGTKDIEVTRIDFLELALTGISTVEMEIFLGSVGREKEAKKNINLFNSATASIIEHIRTIKCSITNMLVELNEIGGFLQQVSGYEEAAGILIEIRKSISYFFLAILQMQGLVHNFVELCLHFMNLIMNTIHSFNIQDLPDFIEEDSDTDKVLEFLQTVVEKDLLEYLFANVKLGYTEKGDTPSPTRKKKTNFSSESTSTSSPSRNIFANIMNSDGGVNNYKDFANMVHTILQKSSLSFEREGHPLLLDYSETQVKDLITNIVPKVNGLTKSLLSIPVLCHVPFESDTFPIIKIPNATYFTDQAIPGGGIITKRKPFSLFLDESLSSVYLSTLLNLKQVLLFEVEVSDFRKPILKSAILSFSRSVQCFEIFSCHHMTVVSYDKEDKRGDREQDVGRSILCQIPYVNIISKAFGVDVGALRSKCGGKSALPLNARVDIPLDVYKPGASLISTNSNIDYLLPIEGFSPSSITVSGARKVGSLLGEDKRTVLILEMEMELSGESTLDETGEEEEGGGEGAEGGAGKKVGGGSSTDEEEED